jgi:hypothetical protein
MGASAMNFPEIEQRVSSLRDQLTQAFDDLNQLRNEHGISLDDVFVLPAIPPEMIEVSPELRAVAEQRTRKLNALLPDVRAAIARADEIGDLLLDAQTQLAFILLKQGRPIAEIATRTGLNEDDVSALAGDPSELN